MHSGEDEDDFVIDGYASCSAPQACQGNPQGVHPNRASMSRLGGAFQTLRDEREAKREEHNTLRNNHSCIQHEYQALEERCKKQEEEHALAIQHTAQNAIWDWQGMTSLVAIASEQDTSGISMGGSIDPSSIGGTTIHSSSQFSGLVDCSTAPYSCVSQEPVPVTFYAF
nr:hypothetical protein Iba_chr06cCG13320 [Ipomoea batatas]